MITGGICFLESSSIGTGVDSFESFDILDKEVGVSGT